MHAKAACAIGCTRLHTDIPLCSNCRERLSAPFGMSFARYSAIAQLVQKHVLKPATPQEERGSIRSAHKNQTFKYMRVRDRVGFNCGTPSDLVAVCQSHARGWSDPLRKGFIIPLGWE